MPTTVFLVLAAACFIRSSQRLYDWLIANKTFGPYLKDYREGKGIPFRAKIVALAMIVIFGSYQRSTINTEDKVMVLEKILMKGRRNPATIKCDSPFTFFNNTELLFFK